MFWVSQPPKTITEMPRLDVAWSVSCGFAVICLAYRIRQSAIAIIDILCLVQNENVLFVTGASSAFLPLSIARGAFLLAQNDVKSVVNATGITVDDFEFTNNFYLARSAEFLRSLSRSAISLSSLCNPFP